MPHDYRSPTKIYYYLSINILFLGNFYKKYQYRTKSGKCKCRNTGSQKSIFGISKTTKLSGMESINITPATGSYRKEIPVNLLSAKVVSEKGVARKNFSEKKCVHRT